MNPLDIASFIGTVAFALSGFMVGARKQLDLLGVMIASLLTALGGGIIRDILLHTTPSALTTNLPLSSVIIVVVIAALLQLHHKNTLEQHSIFVLSDTLGLVAFSIVGALAGIGAELSIFGVILLSVITAVGGGIMRDILINEVPIILVSEFYATVSIVIGLLVWLAHRYFFIDSLSVAFIGFIGLIVRYVAIKYAWHLPKL